MDVSSTRTSLSIPIQETTLIENVSLYTKISRRIKSILYCDFINKSTTDTKFAAFSIIIITLILSILSLVCYLLITH